VSTLSLKPSCLPPATTTRKRKKQEQVSDVEALIKDLSELKVGDPVVHSAHGIGRYRG
jgi:transcription-repair coupling factor (superfamily II helicase)